MSEDLVQLNLSVDRDLWKKVNDLSREFGSKRQVVTTAVETLAILMERYHEGAKKASKRDVRDLFLRVARLMPARFKDATVVEGRFSDGRPALVLDDEWWIAEDRNGELMVVRKDGGEIGYIGHGDIVFAELTERDLALAGALVT
jgi:hypothetical protein